MKPRSSPSRRWPACRALAPALAGAVLAAGCALTSKGETLSIRWFDPETRKPRITSTAPASRAGGAALELGRVVGGSHLREKVAYRDAAFEVGFYDDRRWTERPEVYVRRALARTLYEEHGFRRALAGQAPILDVEVVAFEEIRAPVPAARIELHVVIRDERRALLERTLTVERALPPGTGFDRLVRAMADALDAAAEEVAALAASAAVRERSAPAAPEGDDAGTGP